MRKSHIVWLGLAVSAALALSGCSHVSEDWKAAQTADTSEAYQDFLRQHPDSEFGVSAQERIKQLAEDRDWKQASTADTLDAYQQFVAAHADGKWAQEARVRIENFQLNGTSQPAVAGTAGGAGAPGTSPSGASVAGATAPGAAAAGSAVEGGTQASGAAKPAAKAKSAATHKPPAQTVAKHAASKHSAAKSKTAAGGAHLDQLGAYKSHAAAAAGWARLEARFPSQLHGVHPRYAAGTSHGKPVVRLQVSLSSAARARELCASLKSKSQACISLR